MWIRFLVLAALIYAGVKAFTWVYRSLTAVNRSHSIGEPGASPAIDEMVQDPVCGVYVACGKAISAVVDGKTVYFCSKECRDRYVRQG
jgi:uncharacterized protein